MLPEMRIFSDGVGRQGFFVRLLGVEALAV